MLVWSAVLLGSIGLVMVYSASISMAEAERFTGFMQRGFLALQFRLELFQGLHLGGGHRAIATLRSITARRPPAVNVMAR